MARISQDDFSGQSDASGKKTLNIDAHDQQSIKVPSNDFISDAEMSREGQDLVLESPNGDTLVINNYFMADPAPMIESPDGSILTSNLVHSFLSSPAEFAQASTMADVSPVGAVEEMSGNAKVIRADGTSEEMTLGTPIYKGDIIETSSDGAVNIVFIDETSMAVSQNAKMAIDEYQFDPSTESGETNLSVLRGVFVFTSGLIGRDDPDDVMIDTPVGSIGIRGTIIAGKIQPGGESEITVMEGAIVVKNGAMETTLSQQYESVRLGGFNDNMQDIGVKSAADMGKTYGSVSDVVPKLFSSINDTAKEQKANAAETKKEAAEDAVEDVLEEDTQKNSLEEDLEPTPEESLIENKLETSGENSVETIVADTKKDFSKKRDNDLLNNKHKNIQTGEHDIIHFRGNRENSENVTFNFQEKTVFENADAGTLVGRLFVGNAPAGTTLGLSDNTNYTVTQIVNGVAYVRLSASGASLTSGTVGTALNSVTLIATFPNGATKTWNMNPITADAAVNIGTPGGLPYDVDFIGAGSLPQKTFDLNNDGFNDTINSNPNATVSTITNAGNITIIDGNGATDINIANPTPVSGDHFGESFDSIGDFNGDGKTDFAITEIGFDGDKGKAHINLGSTITTITGNTTGQKLGNHIEGVGDVNGDGKSDVFITNDGTVGGNYEAYVIFGGSGNLVTNNLGANGFTINTGTNKILAGGSVGDTNGDGFDDFAVSVVDGSDVNTYVIYGKNGLGDMTLTDLENPDNALKIHHAGAATNAITNGYNVGSAGDVDGDGFDDVQVGVTGGGQFVVHGELNDMGGTVAYAMDGTPTDGDGNTGVLSPANSSVKNLVGDVHFIDNGETGLSMKGGGGNNHFSLTNNTFTNIDGGNGFDTIRANADIDFSNINFEQISQIERLQVGSDLTKITLTAENLFNLLKTSDNGTLRIEREDINSASGNNRYLEIDAVTPTGSTVQDKIKNLLDNEGSGTASINTENIGGNSYDHFQIGDYHLYIDQSLTTTVV